MVINDDSSLDDRNTQEDGYHDQRKVVVSLQLLLHTGRNRLHHILTIPSKHRLVLQASVSLHRRGRRQSCDLITADIISIPMPVAHLHYEDSLSLLSLIGSCRTSDG
ncbi:hypothetical protein CY34DRAFT_204870 [Suillus luteus UH-Slu-Lm8-n1]|uniref:Uncharacterized protein n=1 Tax=Suillus luteus UH-Slu-Lm8-n1 TaxID=930992 RepID=A0A0D0AI18_9AGAM|nr:hypothetical protein CY34DRAFT_204870 [Suillus luteus UH-Slu-Lm8-n1]